MKAKSKNSKSDILKTNSASCLKFKATSNTKKCSRCSESKSQNLFSPNPRARDDLRSECKACEQKMRKLYRQSKLGYLRKLITSTRTSSRERGRKGREENHTLTMEEFQNKLELYQDRCALSHVQLSFKPYASYRCSVERVDNLVDYTADNVVPIAAEFQTSKQWTSAKMAEIFQHNDRALTDEELDKFSADLTKRKKIETWNARQTRIVDGVTQYLCPNCNDWRFPGQLHM